MHQQGLPAGHHLAAADIGVVLPQGVGDIAVGQPVLEKRLGRDDDVVLLLVPAPGVDLRHPGDLAQFRLDHPVVQGAQLGQAALRVLRAQHIVENLPQSGRDRPQLGTFDPLGQLHARQALHDELAGVEDRHLVLEDGDHLGETELGDGADVDQPRQT